MDIAEQIRQKARELLESGSVVGVIGYERGTLGLARPFFALKPEETDRLIWDNTCYLNLVNFLNTRKGKKWAVVAKPCDSRAVNVLLHENQIKREEVYIIGVTCEGVQKNGQLELRCQHCTQRLPVVYDFLVGEPPAVSVTPDDFSDVTALLNQTPAERLAYWAAQFDRCLRCYACRQACPGCYCSECVADQLDPEWMSIAINLPEKSFFHVMRAYHLAGRCVECNSCEEVCPVNIPLSLLNRQIVREIATLFGGFRAGLDPTTEPPLATFRKDEAVGTH